MRIAVPSITKMKVPSEDDLKMPEVAVRDEKSRSERGVPLPACCLPFPIVSPNASPSLLQLRNATDVNIRSGHVSLPHTQKFCHMVMRMLPVVSVRLATGLPGPRVTPPVASAPASTSL